MIRVQTDPTTASRKALGWMRPFKVGSTSVLSRSSRAGSGDSDLLVADPLPPLAGRPPGAELRREALLDQVVGDLLGRDLQAKKGSTPGNGPPRVALPEA